MGYVNEGLLCCVCRDVLERPLQAPCEHAYCSACISSWLVHHHSCPEDRLPLDVGSLKPLYRYVSALLLPLHCNRSFLNFTIFFYYLVGSHIYTALCAHPRISDVVFDDRYMRNDLSRLQIRCVNAGQGCEVVCSLESLHTHEDECEFAFMSCSNTGMNPHTDLI